MLEDALLEVAQEDKYGKTEIANAGEILRVLRGEISAEAFEEWVGRAAIFLQSKEVLLSWLHGEDEDGELQTEERESGEGTGKKNHAAIALRRLWEEWQNASTPHRRKPAEQLAGELDKTLLELSRETASVEKFMRCVREATEGKGFMPKALSADAENAERATLYGPMSALEENLEESSVKNALRAGASKSSHAVCYSLDRALLKSPTLPGQMGTGGNNGPMVLTYRKTAHPRNADEGQGWEPTDKADTLNVFDNSESRTPVAILHMASGQSNAEIGVNVACTPTNDKDRMPVCYPSRKLSRKYIIRRLTPLECCRLQGFPDDWCSGLGTENPSEDEILFWAGVWETHRKTLGKSSKPKSCRQIVKWLQDPYSDSAEYKMWGNGIALPNAAHVIGCAVRLIKEARHEE